MPASVVTSLISSLLRANADKSLPYALIICSIIYMSADVTRLLLQLEHGEENVYDQVYVQAHIADTYVLVLSSWLGYL